MATSKYISHSERETRSIAVRIASKLQGSEKLCLIGPFGSGKTTFVRGFVSAFGINPVDVQSPTFTLVREYGTIKKIYHVDLYRLDREEDIFEAGIHELLGSDELVIVEWADRLHTYYPHPSITIRFTHAGETSRSIEINGV